MRRISHWSRVLDVAFVQTLLEENRIFLNVGEETTANRYYVDPRQPVLCIGSRASNRLVLETCLWGVGFISSSFLVGTWGCWGIARRRVYRIGACKEQNSGQTAAPAVQHGAY